MLDLADSPVYRHGWCRDFHAETDLGSRPRDPEHFDGGSLHGLPLGGIGTGSIGRDWRGTFHRRSLIPGTVDLASVAADGFAMAQRLADGRKAATVLAPRRAPGPGMEAWAFPEPALTGTYRALFPKALYHYPSSPSRPVAAICEQFSPVIPHHAELATLPVAVFRWLLENPTETPVTVAIMFSFANPLPTSPAGCYARRAPSDRGRIIEFGATGRPMSAAVAVDAGCGATHHACFPAYGDGAQVWAQFSAEARLSDDDTSWVAGVPASEAPPATIAGAVCGTVVVPPAASHHMTFSLAWDLPFVAFGGGRRHLRRHTEWTGDQGLNAAQLASLALQSAQPWSTTIDAWHDAHLAADRPPELTAMLLNELAMLVDGWPVWTTGSVDESVGPFFGVIECLDYPHYDTLDLWSYGSWPLHHLWPEAAELVVRDYARAVVAEDPRHRRSGDGVIFQVNVAGAAPHDLGAPDEDPGALVNSYVYRDPTRWKDLNAHFVLVAHRDSRHDTRLASELLPAVEAAVDHLARHDSDGDGMIENDGTPDQTFDNMPMTGVSAYCGGLWLAALAAAAAMADQVGRPDLASRWTGMGEEARRVFDRELWTGTHYRFDSTSGEAVFAEQLYGPWYAERLGLEPVIPADRARRALRTVLDAAATPDGVVTLTGRSGDSPQVTEVMTGVNLSLACQLDWWGLTREAEQVWETIRREVFETRGLWFRTPSAWEPGGPRFRAAHNLRPLVIWAGVDAHEATRVRAAVE